MLKYLFTGKSIYHLVSIAFTLLTSSYAIYANLTNYMQIILLIFALCLVLSAWYAIALDQKEKVDLLDKISNLHAESRTHTENCLSNISNQLNILHNDTFVVFDSDNFNLISENNVIAITDHGIDHVGFTFDKVINNYTVNISNNIKFDILKQTPGHVELKFIDKIEGKGVVRISFDQY